MPYGKKLTNQEIAARMVELHNLRKLHAHDRKQITELKSELATVKAQNAALKQVVSTLQIQMAELQTMVFGKKKHTRPPMGGTPIGSPDDSLDVHAMPRTKESYHRPIPPASAITQAVAVPLPEACSCGGNFDPARVTTHIRFEEDIPLPGLTPAYAPHLVTKYTIGRGTCTMCGKHTSGKDLGGAEVTLGPHVRLLVCHLVSSGGLSYAQTTNLLRSLYGLIVSSGEIAAILHHQHKKWLPTYHRLKRAIRAAPVRHYDETPWKIVKADNTGYAWVMSASGNPKTVFHLATSRGSRHAQKLHGKNTRGVHITDDYGAYRTLPGQQQLCWAHLYRVIRDLRYNDNLPQKQLPYVTEWYTSFAGIYEALRTYLEQPYDASLRTTQAGALWRRVEELVRQPAPPMGEPDKLRRLKAQLLRAGKAKLFTCLLKDTPCDNNRAERDLRQLVLKRKRSFGSKTERGAKALGTILSVCTTTWRTSPNNYFSQLASLGGEGV